MTKRYRISSGNGPSECELAVTKFYNYLSKHYNIDTVSASEGYNKGTYRSVDICTAENLQEFVGSILWVCKSPYRPTHKRKNWFINFVCCDDTEQLYIPTEPDISIQRIHSGGKGGQNVNKVETGIRAVCIPTGDTVTCTDERSQLANRKKAVMKLKKLIEDKKKMSSETASNNTRIESIQIERGNEVAAFEGLEFRRIK